jgi:porphyrinogen peroxidase
MPHTSEAQSIMHPLPTHARYLFFNCCNPTQLKRTLQALEKLLDPHEATVGLGSSMLNTEHLPSYEHYRVKKQHAKRAPAAFYDLAIWLKAADAGVLFHRARALCAALKPAFQLQESVGAHTYLAHEKDNTHINHDLSGFEDGTENPKGDAAEQTAIIQKGHAPEKGGSCWVLQAWQHDFDALEAMSQKQKEAAIGRDLNDNHELEDAPPSAHLKRTEQESFEPEAFLWRRSMPWSNDALEGGLMFSAFATNFTPFKKQLNRMLGEEDGILDALFLFSRILYTGYFFCPPCKDGRLQLATYARSL